MIIEKIKQMLFSAPKNAADIKEDLLQEPESTLGTNKNIAAYVEEITTILNINMPHVQKVALLFEAYNPQYKQNMVMAQQELRQKEIPADAQFSGAYYFDDRNLIILTEKYPVTDFYTATTHYEDLTDAEHLFHIAHELRHVWQKKYHEGEYYKKNAVAYEVINDPAEVDADAFALAYVFAKKSAFTVKDIPNVSGEICLQATADKGKRWSRAAKLSDDYGFESNEKIAEVKASADMKKIRIMVNHLKLNGIIS